MTTMNNLRDIQRRLNASRESAIRRTNMVTYDFQEFKFTPFHVVNGKPVEEGEVAAWDYMQHSPHAQNPQMTPGSIMLRQASWGRVVGFRDNVTNEFILY